MTHVFGSGGLTLEQIRNVRCRTWVPARYEFSSGDPILSQTIPRLCSAYVSQPISETLRIAIQGVQQARGQLDIVAMLIGGAAGSDIGLKFPVTSEVLLKNSCGTRQVVCRAGAEVTPKTVFTEAMLMLQAEFEKDWDVRNVFVKMAQDWLDQIGYGDGDDSSIKVDGSVKVTVIGEAIIVPFEDADL